jgi:dTDP-4-amino-4,6-dideoxygalactose transaminase
MREVTKLADGFIPFNIPSLGAEEIQEVVDTLQSGWITTGPKTAQFEREFGEYVGAAHALAVNSATAALHLALVALGVGRGSEVITTPLTFCATVNTIQHAGATPVLADVDDDGNIDPESIASRLTSRTRAIMPVHLGGLPCDMSKIWEIAAQNNLYVIEDAAHAIGTHHHGEPIGSSRQNQAGRSDAVCFSFYATKNLTTGEGGMVVTPSAQLHDAMKILCLHGISKDAWNRYAEDGKWYYEVTECGFKYNLSDIASAIGIHQLRKQERLLSIRTRHAALYNEALRGVQEVELPPDNPSHRHAWHLYAIRLNLNMLDIDRKEFIRELQRRNIGTSVHFIPIPLHPAYAELASRPQNQCPRALELYPRLVSLPFYPSMTEAQLQYVADSIKEVVAAHRSRGVIHTGAAFEN